MPPPGGFGKHPSPLCASGSRGQQFKRPAVQEASGSRGQRFKRPRRRDLRVIDVSRAVTVIEGKDAIGRGPGRVCLRSLLGSSCVQRSVRLPRCLRLGLRLCFVRGRWCPLSQRAVPLTAIRLKGRELLGQLTKLGQLEAARVVGVILVEDRLRLRNIRLEPQGRQRRAQL